MTDKEIVERAKEAEKRTGFGELVHSPISKGVNSAFGIGFIEGMVEYRKSLQEEPKKCMYAKENYTDEDRKVLCDCCEEDCEYAQKKEPVSRDYREIYKNIAQSDAFKSAYENKSLGEVMSVEGEEPVSDECIYNRTLEERQRSCKFCSAACQVRIKEEPVSKRFEKTFISMVDATHENSGSYSLHDFAKRLYNIAKEELKEPVSEGLEAFIKERVKNIPIVLRSGFHELCRQLIRDGVEWQKQQDKETIELAEDHAMLAGMEKMKQQIMENAVDATIGLPYENKDCGYTHLVDVSRPLPVGDNKIAIIFKEE